MDDLVDVACSADVHHRTEAGEALLTELRGGHLELEDSHVARLVQCMCGQRGWLEQNNFKVRH